MSVRNAANWQGFEDFCLKLWRPRLIDAKKNGRAGQAQAGVDIFGRDPKTEVWIENYLVRPQNNVSALPEHSLVRSFRVA